MSTARSTTRVGCTLALYVDVVTDVMRCLSGRGAGGELAEYVRTSI